MSTTTENHAVSSPEYQSLLAKFNALQREKANEGSRMKVTEKGSVSFYGCQRFPVTLTKKGWLKIIAAVKDGSLPMFLSENDSMLYQGKPADKE